MVNDIFMTFFAAGRRRVVVVHLCRGDDSATSPSSLPSTGGSNVAGATHHCGLPDPAQDVGTRHLLPSQRGTTPCSPDAGPESVNVSNENGFYFPLSITAFKSSLPHGWDSAVEAKLKFSFENKLFIIVFYIIPWNRKCKQPHELNGSQ